MGMAKVRINFVGMSRVRVRKLLECSQHGFELCWYGFYLDIVFLSCAGLIDRSGYCQISMENML
jgi:hypothetical protein